MPDKCALGKWIYGDGQEYVHLAEMQELTNLHVELHTEVGKTIDAVKAEDMETAKKHKNRVSQLSDEVIAAIDLIEIHVISDNKKNSEPTPIARIA